MAELSHEEVVRAYFDAMAARNDARITELRDPEWRAEWPQSGELVRGDAAMRAIDANFPGGRPQAHPEHVVGSEDRWVMTPVYTVQRLVGSGDSWWGDGTVTYADGKTWHLAILIELRDGRIWRERSYFAEPFEAPAWRAPYVERMDADR